MKFLNRVIRWTEGGLEYEADPRHAELIIKQLGLEEAKEVATPGEKEEAPEDDEDDEELNPEDTGRYRAIAAMGESFGVVSGGPRRQC